MSATKLAIYRCPEHREFFAVILDDDEGVGTRVTPSKCCGRWDLVRSWPIDDHMRATIIKELSDGQDHD